MPLEPPRKDGDALRGVTRVRPHVSLQLVGVLAGIAAQKALEGALPRVRADVTLQFTGLGTNEGHGALSTLTSRESLP